MGPERRPVLAPARPLALEFAFAQRGGERLHGRTCGGVLLRVETGEMLTDNLVSLIPLDALRAGVPTDDVALGIQQIDRVVGDALDKEPEQLLSMPQFLLGLFTLRQVAGDLAETDQLAGRIPNRVDHDVRPELAAVLADSPALAFEPTFSFRGCKDFGWQIGLAVLRGVEPAEVLTKNFLGGIAFEALRTGACSARDMALGIEHVDRLIGDTLDEQAEALLALGQGFGGAPTLVEVAGDLRVTGCLEPRRGQRDRHLGGGSGPGPDRVDRERRLRGRCSRDHGFRHEAGRNHDRADRRGDRARLATRRSQRPDFAAAEIAAKLTSLASRNSTSAVRLKSRRM